MSISQSFFHTFKTDDRLFYGAVVGIAAGLVLHIYADDRIEQASNPKNEFKSEFILLNKYKKACLGLAIISSFFAYSDENWTFGAIGALGMAGAFWLNRQISQATFTSKHQLERVKSAVNLGYLGMACWVAVPAAAFTWQVVQSFIRKT